MEKGPELPNSYYRVSVKALITNEVGELLVINERGAGWGLPGGGLDWGESAAQALKRELNEELGCSAEAESRPSLISPAHAHSHNQHALWIVYRAHIDANCMQKIKGLEHVRYMTITELQEKEEASELNWESPVDFWDELEKLVKNQG